MAKLPTVLKQGIVNIQGKELRVAVLSNKVRVILPASTTVNIESDLVTERDEVMTQIPTFLEKTASTHAKELKSFISKKIIKSAEVTFIDKNGDEATGFDALVLAHVAEAYLKNRDEFRKATGDEYSLAKMPEHIQNETHFAELLICNLAMIGMTALVDESTGYQKVRPKDALQQKLNEGMSPTAPLEQAPAMKTVK